MRAVCTSVGMSFSATLSNTLPKASNCSKWAVSSSTNPSMWGTSRKCFSFRAYSQASLTITQHDNYHSLTNK